MLTYIWLVFEDTDRYTDKRGRPVSQMIRQERVAIVIYGHIILI